jgi:hypothetical protein
MNKLELNTSELLMLKDLLEGDMEQTSYSGSEVEYDDVSLMQYYLYRALVLVKVKELLGS